MHNELLSHNYVTSAFTFPSVSSFHCLFLSLILQLVYSIDLSLHPKREVKCFQIENLFLEQQKLLELKHLHTHTQRREKTGYFSLMWSLILLFIFGKLQQFLPSLVSIFPPYCLPSPFVLLSCPGWFCFQSFLFYPPLQTHSYDSTHSSVFQLLVSDILDQCIMIDLR